MLYTLAGFPFDLFLGIAIAFLMRPRLSPIWAIAICVAMIAPGFFIPAPYHVIFWTPGGAGTMIVGSILVFYALTRPEWINSQPVQFVPDRRVLRSQLLQSSSVEQRQDEYLKLIARIGRTLENNNSMILGRNTLMFMVLFLLFFGINFSALSWIYFKTPEVIKNIFQEFYNTVLLKPGNYDEWFKSLLELAPFQIFVGNMMFTLLMLFIFDKILSYRGIRIPAVGSPVYFRLPFYSLWIYIASGAALFASLELQLPEVYELIARNGFGILSALYIFQGLSLLWLYLQVRLLPAGVVISALVFSALLVPAISLFIFGLLLLLGLLDFWIDLRKKALHPDLMSNDV